jgi:hypothetical protein
MSGWGKYDNITATGTVTVTNGSTTVTGNATTFVGNVVAGDYVTIAGLKYKVAAVANATSLTITTPKTGGTSTAVKAYIQQGPKSIRPIVASGNTNNAVRSVIGVDSTEAANVIGKSHNINQPGWVATTTYTDAFGNTRYKVETLVATSKNFNRNSSGVLQQDGADDTFAPQ